MSATKIVVITLVSLVVGFFLYIFIAFGGLGCIGSRFTRGPEIRRAEFPFRLEYEVSGEFFVVEDALVIQFAGNDWNAGWGTHPTWRGSLASGQDVIILFADHELEIFIRPAESNWRLRQLMGEGSPNWNINLDANTTFPAIWRTINGNTREITNDPYNIYNIRIISWEIAPPIENTFP